MSDPHGLGPLLGRARQGDPQALDALLGRLRPYLHDKVQQAGGVQGRGLGNSDLVQLTLLGIYKGFPRFQGTTPGELLAWAGRICQNLILTALRKRPSPDGADTRALPSPRLSPGAVAEETEERLRLLAAVERLPEHRRQVVRLRIYEELPFAEVARRLGKGEEACRVLWVRALAELRGKLEGNP
jgi:RNA polymerase sigma factor (sigma-70 family)